jgi:glycerophosphoryl diester phosphodiesterase
MNPISLCRRVSAVVLVCLVVLVVAPVTRRAAVTDSMAKKILVAHRGASAYAPEHTIESYELAIKQGADFVEQDLQITKDGVLVCLHDESLERTTNVEEMFPDRFTEERASAATAKRWLVADFTLKEIKQLDAGSWFAPQFKGARVPTFGEAIKLIRGRAGLYSETKAPEVYGRRGFEMERLVLAELKRHGLDRPGADRRTPVIIQSFSAASLRKMRAELKTELPLVLLIGAENKDEWLTPAGLKRAREFARGIGPAKALVNASVVKAARDAGLTITPYTFRSRHSGQFASVREEMNHYLYTLGVDAVFTDNPDEFPRGRSR